MPAPSMCFCRCHVGGSPRCSGVRDCAPRPQVILLGVGASAPPPLYARYLRKRGRLMFCLRLRSPAARLNSPPPCHHGGSGARAGPICRSAGCFGESPEHGTSGLGSFRNGVSTELGARSRPVASAERRCLARSHPAAARVGGGHWSNRHGAPRRSRNFEERDVARIQLRLASQLR